MSKSIKRALSLLLCAALLLGAAPLNGFGGLELPKLSSLFATKATALEDDYSVGDIIEFGSYPQEKVEDNALITTLNSLPQLWKSYGYYSGTGSWNGEMTASDYMQYCDVTYAKQKYRGVRFLAYRPYDTGYACSETYSQQDDNGYYINTVYWFKWEPLQWRVLDPSSGLVMSNKIIDAQPFHNTTYTISGYSGSSYYSYTYQSKDSTIAPSDYNASSIRAWLNEDFFGSAFTKSQKMQIRSTTASGYTSVVNDKLFLLDLRDVFNSTYGFTDNIYEDNGRTRYASSTAYAKCQGESGNSWTLRSHYETGWGQGSYKVNSVPANGKLYSPQIFSGSGTAYVSGIRPAMTLNLSASIVQTGEGAGKLVTVFPQTSSINPYKGLIVEATAKMTGEAFSCFVTGDNTVTMSGIDESQAYDVVLRSEQGVVFCIIDNLLLDTNNEAIVEWKNIKPRRAVTLTVKDDAGKTLKGGYTIQWSLESGTFLGAGNTVKDVTTGTKLIYEVKLSDELAAQYAAPTAQHVTVGIDSVALTLNRIPTKTVSGVVKAADGTALQGALVSIVQQFNANSSKNTAVTTDENGLFSANVLNVPLIVTVQKNGYRDMVWSGTAENFKNDMFLQELTGTRLLIDLSEVAADTYGSNGSYSVPDLDYAVTIDGTTWNEMEVQYPYLNMNGIVPDGATVCVTATDRSGVYLPATDTFIYQASKTNKVSLGLTEKGHVTVHATSSENNANTLLLFDTDGKLVRSVFMPGLSVDSGTLDEGTYTVVLLGSSVLLSSLPTLSFLAEFGLRNGIDYFSKSVIVQNGKLTDVSGFTVPDLDETKLYKTDPDKTSLFINTSSASVGQNILLRVAYGFSEDKTVENETVEITLPDDCAIVTNSLTVNGYVTANYKQNKNVLTVPTKGGEGVIRLYVRPAKLVEGELLPFVASLSCVLNGNSIIQPIGTAQVVVNEIEWSVPAKTAEKTVTAIGKTAPNASVELYDNGVLVGKTISNSTGSFTTPFELVKSYSHSTHDLKLVLKTADGITFTSGTKKLIYDAQFIAISKVTMVYRGSRYLFDFLTPRTDRMYYSYVPGNSTFSFEVECTVNDPERVTGIQVITTSSRGEKTYIPVRYNADKGCWVGSCSYDSFNCPVKINARCESWGSYIEIDADEFAERAQDQLDKKVPYFTGENDRVIDPKTNTVEISGKRKQYSFRFDYVETQPDSDRWICANQSALGNCYVWLGDDNETRQVSVLMSIPYVKALMQSGETVEELREIAEAHPDSKGYIRITMDLIDESQPNLRVKKAVAQSKQSSCVNTDGFIQDIINQGIHPDDHTADAWRQVLRLRSMILRLCKCYPEYTQDLYNRLDNLASRYFSVKDVLNVIDQIQELLFRAWNNDIASNSTQVVLTFTNLLFDAGFSAAIAGLAGQVYGFSKNCPDDGDDNDDDDDDNGGQSISFSIDPSGYVCEAVPSNRLEGVTVTCFYSPYEDGADAVVWDAAEYDQQNPLSTDENGYYEWFVPEGWWQVRYEKDGYLIGYSDWLPVPPPQTEVHYAMTSTAAPTVEAVNAYPDGVEIRFSQYMDLTTVTDETVAVAVGGSALTGSIYPVNAEASFADPGVQYASVFKFVADMETPLSGSVTVTATTPKNYAGTAMESSVKQTVSVTPRIESVKTDANVVLEFGKTKTLTLSVLPSEAGSGRTVTITSDSPSVVSVSAAKVTTNKQSQATVTLKGELPGATSITYRVDGTDIVGMTTVSVSNEKETCKPVTASLESGSTVDEGTTVTLSTATPGAQIYYTTDGTCPCLEDSDARTLYTGPITLTESVRIIAYAVKEGCYDSGTTVLNYTVNPKESETCEPVTASIESGSEVEKGTTVTLSTATPGAQIYYTTDGTCPCLLDNDARTLYTGPITLTESVRIIAYAVKDGYYDSGKTILDYTVILKVRSVKLDDVTLNYKDKVSLKPDITADAGVTTKVKYESANPNVAKVDENGTVTGMKRGSTTITCTVTDGNGNTVKDTCKVTVKYTLIQWIIIILLFGWLWY